MKYKETVPLQLCESYRNQPWCLPRLCQRNEGNAQLPMWNQRLWLLYTLNTTMKARHFS